MELENVFEKVKDAIAASCGLARDTIQMDSTLFADLNITSIDMVDIMYTLETDFNITLKISDIENEARSELNGAPFEIDNLITPEGLEALKRRLPEIPVEKLVPGLTIHEIANLLTVRILCNMIIYTIEKEKKLSQ